MTKAKPESESLGFYQDCYRLWLDGKRLEDIADAKGVKVNRLRNYFAKHREDFPTPSTVRRNEIRKVAIRMFNEGHSIKEIMAATDSNRYLINRLLLNSNIYIRSRVRGSEIQAVKILFNEYHWTASSIASVIKRSPEMVYYILKK